MRVRRLEILLAHPWALLIAAVGCADPGPGEAVDEIARVSAGIAFFEARASADPQDYLSHRQLVRRYGERFALAAAPGDPARAEAAARRLLATSPARSEAWARLSAVYLMQHRFAEALAAADSAVALVPGDPEAVGASYDANLALGQYERAYQALLSLPRASLATRVRWASWHLLGGRDTAARTTQTAACLGLARGNAPALARAWCLTELGRIVQEAGEFREAAATYAAALAVQPGYRGAIEGLADLALARQAWGEARRLYRRILSPAHPDLYLRLAETETGLGRARAAAAAQARFLVLTRDPGQEALQGPEIVAHLLSGGPGGFDSALVVARRETERRPTLESWSLLARVHEVRGEADAAAAIEAHIASIRDRLTTLQGSRPDR